jgi:hypothetical protein
MHSLAHQNLISALHHLAIYLVSNGRALTSDNEQTTASQHAAQVFSWPGHGLAPQGRATASGIAPTQLTPVVLGNLPLRRLLNLPPPANY